MNGLVNADARIVDNYFILKPMEYEKLTAPMTVYNLSCSNSFIANNIIVSDPFL